MRRGDGRVLQTSRRNVGEPVYLEGEAGDMRLFFFSSRRRHTRLQGDWSSDVCSSDLEHVEIERVAMVVRRSLAVAAVDDNLAIDLVDQDPPAERFTTAARTKLRQRAAGDVERQRFAEQMRVRAEVIGEIPLDMSGLAIDS